MRTGFARKAAPRLLGEFTRTVRERRLFDRGHHVLVAVSGGPDSMALLALVLRLGPSWRLRVTAAHVNYRLRGAESDDDEAFVRSFCDANQVPLLVFRPTLERRRRRSSLQDLARAARYEALRAAADRVGADRICVGHTADDQAETMLMWMLRGAGLAGLAGMPFVREGSIVRPLLAVTREQVLEFLDHESLPYRIDSSNGTTRYRRNRIRMELLPVVKSLAPSAVRLLQRQAELLREEERYLDESARAQRASLVLAGGRSVRLNRSGFVSLPKALQRRLVRLLLREFEPEGRAAGFRVVESTCRFIEIGRDGAIFHGRDAILRREGDAILWEAKVAGSAPGPACPPEQPMTLPLGTSSTCHWSGSEVRLQFLSRQEAAPLLQCRSTLQAVFDADRFSSPLLLRCWQPGDRFQPCGMRGKSKKLQDFFTDLKIARPQRAKFPVLAAPEGILWVAGLRQDERFMVGQHTRRCLVATIIGTTREGAP